MRHIALFFVAISLYLNQANASCGSASCPLHEPINLRLFNAAIAFEYIDQNSIFVGSQRSFVGAIPHDHDEVRTINRLASLRLGYRVWERFGLRAVVPWVDRFHTHIGNEEEDGALAKGVPFSLQHGGAGPESWNISGLGDIRLFAQGIVLNDEGEGGPFLGVSAGLKFPTGVTDAVNEDGEKAEVTIQPGTGSYDILLGADFTLSVGAVPGFDGVYSDLPLFAGVSYRLNGKGTDDYRFGDVVVATVGTRYRLMNPVVLMFQANGRFEGYADVGRTGEPRENTGSTRLYASPGVSVSLTNLFSLTAFVQIPVYQNVHGIQQVSDVNLHVALQAALD